MKLTLLLHSSLLVAVSASEHCQARFEDVSHLLGPFYVGESMNDVRGVSWLDYDQDGHLDILIPNSDIPGLFRNLGNGTFSENLAEQAGLGGDVALFTQQAVVGDLDNNGYPDLIFLPSNLNDDVQLNSVLVFKNNGDGTFTDVSKESGIGQANGYARGASIGDFDNDGLLDLFIGGNGNSVLLGLRTKFFPNKLYRNTGNFTFEDVSQQAGIEGYFEVDGEQQHGQACISAFHDYNGDRYPDIIVGNCVSEPTPGFYFFRNNKNGTFTDVSKEIGWDLPGVWMGLTVGDWDGDGDLDLYTGSTGTLQFPIPLPSHPDGVYGHALWTNHGNGTYTSEVDGRIPNHEFNWGSTFLDVDNDGDLDLATVGSLPIGFGVVGAGLGNPGHLFMNNISTRTFEDCRLISNLNLEDSFTSGFAQGDFDGDGYPDLLIMAGSFGSLSPIPEGNNSILHPVLLRNKGGDKNNYVTVRLVGTKSNRDGLGAVVRVQGQVREVRSGISFASTEQVWPHFGLGDNDDDDAAMVVVKVKVQWPSGLDETFEVPINQVVEVVEGTATSASAAPTKSTNHTIYILIGVVAAAIVATIGALVVLRKVRSLRK